MNTLFGTWKSLTKQFNRQQELVGRKPLTFGHGKKVCSFSWFSKRCHEREIAVVAVGSREDKDAEPEDIHDFIRDVPALFKEKNIDPRAHMQFDEFNDIKGTTQRRMTVKRGGPAPCEPGVPIKNHCPQTSGGRKTLSASFVLTPTWSGRALVVVDKCPKAMAALIRTQLGSHIHLVINETGNMHGTT